MGKESFSRSVKEELAKATVPGTAAAFWEAHALRRFLCDSPSDSPSSGLETTLAAEPFLLRRLYYLERQGSGLHPSFKRQAHGGNRTRPNRKVQAKARIDKIRPSPDLLVRDETCRRAYLRGVFLAKGYVASPLKTHHLELALPNKREALLVQSLISVEGLRAGLIKRRSSWVVYMKNAGHIVEFLKMTGASNSLLKYEDIRVRKSLKNSVQRLVNMDRANVSRSVEASLKQLEHIRIIDQEKGLSHLPPALRELARLRILNPGLSLEELGELLNPPASKSAVNHRFRRIAKIAENLAGEKE